MKDKIKKLEDAKEAIQQQIDKLKEPKFETGKWYLSNCGNQNALIYCESITSIGEAIGYGINYGGDWSTGIHGYPESSQLATNSEVQAALIKEAKKRGFKQGVTFSGTNIDKEYYSSEVAVYGNIKWAHKGEWLAIGKGDNEWIIFKDGKWATIVENKLTINGYVMETEDNMVIFGCARFHRDFFTRLLSVYEVDSAWRDMNRNIKSITLDSGVTITVDELTKIVKQINK